MKKPEIKSYLNLEQNQSTVTRQYTVFFAVGAVSFLLGILFLRIFYRDLGISLLVSNILSFVIVSAINYLLSIRFVFLRGRFTLLKEVLFFYILAISSLVMDSILLLYLVEKMELWYIIAKTISVMAVSFITFALKKFLIFKN
jgi:putative flippase GtrA